MRPYRFVFFVSIILFGVKLRGQGVDLNYVLPKILPAAPEASAIVKGGDFNVGNFTGTAQFNIPLFTLKYRSVNVPVSLHYSSNGVKVNDLPSRVGMDWTLNAGGVITRTIMDEPDNVQPLSKPPANLDDTTLAKYVFPVYFSGDESTMNTQPDEYTFNFNGYSGKFYYDADSQIHKIGITSLRIERNGNIEDSTWNFKITDPTGIIYVFGGNSAREKTLTVNYPGPNLYKNQYQYTSWYLKQIIYPSTDSVSFTYSPINYSNYVDVSQSFSNAFYTCGDGGSATLQPNYTVSTVRTLLEVQGVILTRINGNDGTSISFYNSIKPGFNDKKYDSILVFNSLGHEIKKFSFVYQITGVSAYSDDFFGASAAFGYYRFFLTEVAEEAGGIRLSHKFEYNDPAGLPPIFSFAQDHLGYFNGKHNQSAIPILPTDVQSPAYSICDQATSQAIVNQLQSFGANREPDTTFGTKGTLKRITYPTGGTTTVNWEPNDVFRHLPVIPFQVNQFLDTIGSNQNSSRTKNGAEFYIGFDQTLNIHAYTALTGDGSPLETNHIVVNITNTSTNTNVFSETLNNGDNLNFTFDAIAGNFYQFSLTVYGKALEGIGTINFRPGGISYLDKNIIMPGFRVKSILFDNGSGSNYSKNYFYCDSINNRTKSSGVILPVEYQRQYNYVLPCLSSVDASDVRSYAENQLTTTQINSCQLLTNRLANQPNIIYSRVVEADDSTLAHGGLMHFYKGQFDVPGLGFRGNPMLTLPSTNSSFTSGLEDSVLQYKNVGSSFVLQKKIKNYFSYDTVVGLVLPQFVFNQRWTIHQEEDAPHYATPTILYLDMFDFGMYNRITNWMKLDSTIETDIGDNGSVQTIKTSNGYSNYDNYQTTRISTVNSKGDTVVKKYRYPSEFAATDTLFASMKALNIVAPVIEEEDDKNSSFLFLKRTNMKWSNGAYVPANLQLKKGAALNDTRIVFNKYDSLTNIVEQQKANDVKEVYLWGYHATVPVAKVLNSTYDAARALVDPSILNAPSSDAALRTELNKLRSLSNTQVTTYTYNPLIGPTSETDPSGKTTYYEYDGFNRLKNIKDYQGNIVKNFGYNYQGGCGNNCQVLPMQTFTSYATPGYPVGVFNKNKSYVGIAHNQGEYVTLWNTDTANQALGTLAANADTLKFNLTLAANAVAPQSVFGLRYYQWVGFNQLNLTLAVDSMDYVDYGDGSHQLVTQQRAFLIDSTPYGYGPEIPYLHLDTMCRWIVLNHTYSTSSPRTLSVFQNETSETVGFVPDGDGDTTHSFIRGNYPALVKSIQYNGMSMASDTGVTNFSSLHNVVMSHYMFGSSQDTRHNQWQSIDNFHQLKWLKLVYKNGDEIVSNEQVNFPNLMYYETHEFRPDIDTMWSGVGFPNLYIFVMGLPVGDSITTVQVDNILNKQAGYPHTGLGIFGFGPVPQRSHASDAAWNLFNSLGWYIQVDPPSTP